MENTLALAAERTKAEKVAVCDGSMPLDREDRIELLAVLASDADPEISERANATLAGQPLQNFLAALVRTTTAPQLFCYCAKHLGDKPGIADALAKNGSCPAEMVGACADYLTSEGIQALLDDLDRFTSDQKLIAIVSASPAASASQRELLGEMAKGALSTEEIAALVEAEPDPVQRETMLQKLSRMTVVQRLTTALKGGRGERMFLIRDPNKLVQRCVLQSPRLTDTEVEGFAAMSNVSADVLRGISMTRVFMKNYGVVKNLCNNPKTPLDISLHLFQRLNVTDLTKLTTNKNVPETLRSSAQKLQRKRRAGAD
jgi:hypothetical protein